MAANYPALIALMFVFCSLAGLAVAVAVPISTVILFAWNFVASRWAIAGRPAPQRAS
jgi:putative flippase GtrA